MNAGHEKGKRMNLIIAENLKKEYRMGDVAVQAIRGVDFAIEPASFVSFVGPSGSGKTTLLNMIGCLDRPTGGRLSILGTDVSGLDTRASAGFRGKNIGFVFQDFNLLPVLTAYENIEYPLVMVQSWTKDKRRQRVEELLEAVGMADQADKRPDQLSGGQKQRVAVARALVTNPKLVLADEPTANLDRATAHRIIELMKRLRDEFRTTFVFSTHDPKIVAEAELIYSLEDGIFQNGSGPGGTQHA
jgi:putative ABC transport system ATP-binding protein